MIPPPPIALSIAGTDPSGGAGIQADLKTFHGLGVYGCAVVTSVNAQNTLGVQRVEPVAADLVGAQVRAVLGDTPPVAIKIGQLGKRETILAVGEFLSAYRGPVVVDPVFASTGGRALLDADALATFREHLLPRVTLLTPNLEEARLLLGRSVDLPGERELAARDLLALGPRAVLLKGGHARLPLCGDFWTDGNDACWINAPRLDVTHTHGGGCTLSSAIAAGLAHGLTLLDAVVLARAYVNQGLRRGGGIGQGRGPLAHLGWPDSPEDMPWLTRPGESASPRLAFPALGKLDFGLYPIVDRADWVERLLNLGVELVQLRAKDLRGPALEQEVVRAIETGRRTGARVFINDAWELALKHGAYGVHLGQDDLPGADLSALARAGLRLGISTHGYAEAARALSVIPSYLAIGTLYESPSKTFAHQPLGLENFARLRKLVPVPVVAIGGITRDRAPAVRAAGADSIAVISDITRASDLAGRVAEWQRVLSRPTGSG